MGWMLYSSQIDLKSPGLSLKVSMNALTLSKYSKPTSDMSLQD